MQTLPLLICPNTGNLNIYRFLKYYMSALGYPESGKSVLILHFTLDFLKCFDWILSHINLQFGISEIMTDKLLFLVKRDFHWCRISSQPGSINQVCDWYCTFVVILRYFDPSCKGSIIVTPFRLNISFFPSLLTKRIHY